MVGIVVIVVLLPLESTPSSDLPQVLTLRIVPKEKFHCLTEF